MRVHMCEVQNIFFLITTSVSIIIIYNDNIMIVMKEFAYHMGSYEPCSACN